MEEDSKLKQRELGMEPAKVVKNKEAIVDPNFEQQQKELKLE